MLFALLVEVEHLNLVADNQNYSFSGGNIVTITQKTMVNDNLPNPVLLSKKKHANICAPNLINAIAVQEESSMYCYTIVSNSDDKTLC